MSITDQQLTPIPSNSPESRIADLEGKVQSLLRLANSGDRIGRWVFTVDVPANWNTPGATIIVDGNLLVPNGPILSRADFPGLNTILAARGYPYGAGDGSTTFGGPDALGRGIVCVGTHADTAEGKTDGVTTLLNRTPKHNTTNGLTITGAPGGGPFVTSVGHVDSTYQGGITAAAVQSVSGPTAAVTVGSLAVGGSIGPGGTRPIDTGSYIVIGIMLLVALP